MPVTWILDRQPSHEHFHLATENITSFIVPFAGPHECPNSKTCPNNRNGVPPLIDSSVQPQDAFTSYTTNPFESTFSDNECNLTIGDHASSNGLYNSFFSIGEHVGANNNHRRHSEAQHDDLRWLGNNGNPEARAADPCPFPTSVCWWKTLDGKHCSIIGYSDGTICIVGKCAKRGLCGNLLRLYTLLFCRTRTALSAGGPYEH